MIKFSQYILIVLCLASCKLYFQKNHQLQSDYELLSSHDFADKYYTLYKSHNVNKLGLDSTYKSYWGVNEVQYIHLGKDWFIYESPFFIEENYSSIGLKRKGYYQICDSTIKMEYIAQNPGSVYTQIFEGEFNARGIELKKKYNSGAIFKRKMSSQIFNAQTVEINQFNEEVIMINLEQELRSSLHPN